MKVLSLIVLTGLFLTGCSFQSGTSYNESWSKAKNLSYAAGLDSQMYDQQLPAAAYNKDGKLLDYKLNNVTHPAYGGASGVVGVNVQPYGPFENLYWGWTVPGASHHSEHRLFAWMPNTMAADTLTARDTLQSMLSRASLTILEEMGFTHESVTSTFEHEGVVFQQWYLEQEGGNCSLSEMNCVLSLYIPQPTGEAEAPSFSFYNVASERTWFFEASDDSKYPRLVLAEGKGKKSVSANVFYQKLSARLPGWVYFYMAPNEVGIGDNNQTVAYPYLLEKGTPLLFIRPVK